MLSSVSDPPNSRARTCSNMNRPVTSFTPQSIHLPRSLSHMLNFLLADRLPRLVVPTSSISIDEDPFAQWHILRRDPSQLN